MVLRKIASWNQSQSELVDYLFRQKIDTNDKKIFSQTSIKKSLKEGLKEDKNLLINFLLMLALWSLVSCNYYINQYQIKGLDENL